MLYVDGVGGAGGGIATLCRGHEGHGHDGGERQHAECFYGGVSHGGGVISNRRLRA